MTFISSLYFDIFAKIHRVSNPVNRILLLGAFLTVGCKQSNKIHYPMKTFYISICQLFLLINFAYSQSQKVSTHVPWTKEDSAAINALALYPDSTRLKIYQACEYPAIIVNAASLQKNSSTAFANLINSYSKSQQEDLWNLSRYPNLISELVEGGQKSKPHVDSILTNYPSDIHDVAEKYALNNYEILKNIDDLQKNIDRQFQQMLASYPQDVQQLFNQLIQLPALFNLLNEDLSLTVRVGDHYKREPQQLIHKMDSVATAMQQQQAKDVQDWKNTMQTDSNARNEMQAAANEYADSNGYNTNQVDQSMDDVNVDDYNVVPYTYWFGYPYWYPYDYWYPYPYWYDWGFYYGAGGNMVVFGMPSYYFTNWYFYRPRYWSRYPHLGAAFVDHYDGQDGLNTMSRMVVHNWVQENRAYLPANFTNSRGIHRSEVMKQLGNLNQHALNRDGTIDNTARSQYYNANKASFSALNKNPAEPGAPQEQQIPDVRQPFSRQPAVNPSRVNSRQAQPQSNGGNGQRQISSPRVRQYTNTPRYNYNYSNIQRANSYHSAGWSQPSRGYSGGGNSGNFGGGGGSRSGSSGGGGVRSGGGGRR